MELGPEDVSLLERCPHFRGWYVQASMELGPEDVSLLERCPHFRGWYVQASDIRHNLHSIHHLLNYFPAPQEAAVYNIDSNSKPFSMETVPPTFSLAS